MTNTKPTAVRTRRADDISETVDANVIKEDMTEYWGRRAEEWADLRLKEFHSYKRQLWLDELEHYLPAGRRLQILDIGTGSGFFTFLLTAAGHDVIGIDLTQEMIMEARITSEELDIPANFAVMDAEHPAFPADYFDAIVTRNLTWTLPHLGEAYRQWARVLRPGGVMVNFDADYTHTQETDSGLPERNAHEEIQQDVWDKYVHMKEELAPEQKRRPVWDKKLLKDAGFTDIAVDNTLSDRLFAVQDEFYNPTRMFTLSARLPK